MKLNIDFKDKQLNELVAFLSEHFPEVEIQVDSDSIDFTIKNSEFHLFQSLTNDIIENNIFETGVNIHDWNDEFRNYLLSLKSHTAN